MRKEQMITRANKLNLMLEERGIPFRIAYSSFPITEEYQKEGYSFQSKTYNMTPILYFSEEWWGLSDPDLVDRMEQIFKEYAKKVDLEEYLSKEYMLSHVRPVLSSAGNIPVFEEEEILYIQYLDMTVVFELVLTDDGEETSAMKIKKWNMDHASEKISMAELITAAQEYLDQNYEVVSMDDILSGYGDTEKTTGTDNMFSYIVTTKNHIKGASAILSSAALKKVTEVMGTEKVFLIPTSIHEMMIVPSAGMDVEYLKKMIKVGNQTVVSPENRLTDSIYLLQDGEIHLI